MRWRDGRRRRKSWKSYAGCWMSMRGESHDELRELDLAGNFADVGLDLAALYLARRGACGRVCRRRGGFPECGSALRDGGGHTGGDDGGTGDHIRLAAWRFESGRAVRGAGDFALVGKDGAASGSCRAIQRSGRSIANRNGDAVAGRSLVPGGCSTEPENCGRTVLDRADATQGNQAGGARAARTMCGAATEDGSRSRHSILRVSPAGCACGY